MWVFVITFYVHFLVAYLVEKKKSLIHLYLILLSENFF